MRNRIFIGSAGGITYENHPAYRALHSLRGSLRHVFCCPCGGAGAPNRLDIHEGIFPLVKIAWVF